MRDTGSLLIWFVLFIVLIFAVPLFFLPQHLYLFDLAQIYAILAMSLALTVGYAGHLSIAHPVFFGVGAYFTGLTMIAGLPFLVVLFLAGLSSSLIALVVGYPSLRTKGVYFAITTLCLTIIFEMVLNNWVSLTQGPSGLSGIPKPGLLSGAAMKTSLIIYRVTHSEIGRTMIVIRDQKKLSSLMGINTLKYELINFSMGAFFAGIAGGVYAVFIRYLHPTDFGIQQSFDILAMVVVGGPSGVSGPIMGSFFINFFPELLGIDPALKRIAYGIVIILVVIFMPNGLQGILREGLLRQGGKLVGSLLKRWKKEKSRLS